MAVKRTQKTPPIVEPRAVVLAVYGNNATVACPCGRILVVRSNPSGSGGWYTCHGTGPQTCGRSFLGIPPKGNRITYVDVWEANNSNSVASYRVPFAGVPQTKSEKRV